ncbi:hypothetical protein ABPG72_021737 [Tetrahymena utriculariae]
MNNATYFKLEDLTEKGLNNIKKYRAIIMYLEESNLSQISEQLGLDRKHLRSLLKKFAEFESVEIDLRQFNEVRPPIFSKSDENNIQQMIEEQNLHSTQEIHSEVQNQMDVECSVSTVMRLITKFGSSELPPLKGNQKYRFQKDNAPSHKPESIKNYIKDNNFIIHTHPPNSPDLNPIEFVWSQMKNNVEKASPKNKGELEDLILGQFDLISTEFIQNCINHLKSYLSDVLHANGEYSNQYYELINNNELYLLYGPFYVSQITFNKYLQNLLKIIRLQNKTQPAYQFHLIKLNMIEAQSVFESQ